MPAAARASAVETKEATREADGYHSTGCGLGCRDPLCLRWLAVTLLSELQMGQLALEDAGPEQYEDEHLADWTWEIVTRDVEDTWEFEDLEPMKQVEIIVSRPGRGFEYRLVHLFPADTGEPVEEEEPLEPGLEPDVPPQAGGFGGRR